MKCGLYRTAEGHLVNADTNGVASIIQKLEGWTFALNDWVEVL